MEFTFLPEGSQDLDLMQQEAKKIGKPQLDENELIDFDTYQHIRAVIRHACCRLMQESHKEFREKRLQAYKESNQKEYVRIYREE